MPPSNQAVAMLYDVWLRGHTLPRGTLPLLVPRTSQLAGVVVPEKLELLVRDVRGKIQ
jgi:hypothetical protein